MCDTTWGVTQNVRARFLYDLYLGLYVLDYVQGAVPLTQAVSRWSFTAKTQVQS